MSTSKPHGPFTRALLALVLTVSVPARALAPSSIPVECGSRASLDAQLRQRLGETAPVDQVQVSIFQSGSAFRLRVQVEDEVRELDDPSCQELLRAAVVIAVAMLLHEPTPDPPPPPAAAPAPSRSTPPAQWALAAGLGASVGTLPTPVLTPELETKLLWPSWGLALELRYLPPSERRDDTGRGVRLQAFGAGASGIFRPSRRWEARLGFATQHLFGKGLGAGPDFESESGGAWAAGPTLGLGFVPYQARALWLGLGAEGQLNLVRGHFEIRHYSGEIYDVPWLSAAAFVRLGLIW